MKQLTRSFTYKSLLTFLTFAFLQTLIWAQDSSGGSSSSTTSTTRSVTSTSGNWYASPWVWVVGAVLLILLLVALMRGKSDGTTATRTDRVTVKESTTIE